MKLRKVKWVVLLWVIVLEIGYGFLVINCISK